MLRHYERNKLLWLGSLALAILITAALTIPPALAVGIYLARLILRGG